MKFYSLILIGLTYGLVANAQSQEAGETTSALPRSGPAMDLSQQKPHIGLRGGLANPEHNYDGGMEYGIEAGIQPYIPISVGVELTTFHSDNDTAPDLNRTKLLAKGNYNFGGTIPVIKHSYVGALIGPVFDVEGDVNRGRLGMGPQAGFDIPLTTSNETRNQSFSLGANLNYLFVSNSAPDTFGMNGVVKYWF